MGTAAFNAKGEKFVLTKEALESGAESWTGGIVTINHMVKEKGKITKSWFEDPYVYATFEGLPQEAVDAINSAAYRGVSQESLPLEVKDGQVLKLKGTGSTFVFYPFKPACKIQDGCGIPISSFNFPFYTTLEKLESNTPGGVDITEDINKLESTISEQKTEIGTLKSTIDELRQELKNKDGQIESTVQAAVKAALESHDLKLKEQAEMDAAITELKSCMGPETMATFLDAKPSPAIIKSTIAAIKADAGKHVGAASGTQSTTDDDKTYSIGSWDAEKKSYV